MEELSGLTISTHYQKWRYLWSINAWPRRMLEYTWPTTHECKSIVGQQPLLGIRWQRHANNKSGSNFRWVQVKHLRKHKQSIPQECRLNLRLCTAAQWLTAVLHPAFRPFSCFLIPTSDFIHLAEIPMISLSSVCPTASTCKIVAQCKWHCWTYTSIAAPIARNKYEAEIRPNLNTEEGMKKHVHS